MRTLDRLRRVVPNALALNAVKTFRYARALEVALIAANEGRLPYEGEAEAVEYLLPAMRRWKPMLLAGACRCCGDELATHGRLCKWCVHLVTRRYSYRPRSAEEDSLLQRLACDSR